MNKIIDGKAISATIINKIGHEVLELKNQNKRMPTLAVILVGDNSASKIYVKNKKLACNKANIHSIEILLDEQTTTQILLDNINQLNSNPQVDGILLQLPIPLHIDAKKCLDAISFQKDVDGFHRYNMGALFLNNPNISPCTPHGVMYLLDSINLQYKGLNAVIIGASNIVGRPMAIELLNRDATVSICHKYTQNLSDFTKNADLIVVAAGVPNLLVPEMIKDGVVIIDVGINRLESGKVVGDVDFDGCLPKVKYITPVPGGVGPMTIAMLLINTMQCYYINSVIK